jgi:hypothetical protein
VPVLAAVSSKDCLLIIFNPGAFIGTKKINAWLLSLPQDRQENDS